ncbi:MAG: DNA repair protein RecN [Rhodobacterales bacterium]|nr:MAG: DNA repair protein RecN [Rhodobacterales bacterium]
MLSSLEIRDILIIEHLALNFQPGLNVLTGETGAGKSILLDALGFVLGWRGRADLVRSGAAQGEVCAVFDLPPDHPAHTILAEAGIPCDEGELILRRVNSAQGRKTAWVNERRVSGDVLRALSDVLVELHGQFDDRGLLNPRGHMALLDAFGGHIAARDKLRRQWDQVAKLLKTLEKTQSDHAAMQAEEDYLRHAIDELDKLAPQAGEEAELDARRRLMQGAERIGQDMQKAAAAISFEGAEGQMSDASRWLEGAIDGAGGQLEEPLQALHRAQDALAEAQQGLERAMEALSFNPEELEQTEERLFAIRALARKHGVAPDDLAGFADELRRRLNALDQGAGQIADLQDQLAQQQQLYMQGAEALSAGRRKSAKALDKAMAAQLVPLKMERAVFTTQISATTPGPEGQDQVVFTAATNPGAPTGALNKIASGGELSRFLLALKVCLTAGMDQMTMIFDEIDRGVGGATADAVGQRLADLATGSQLLVVTHSPQVAAKGNHHFRVQKSVSGGQTRSQVVTLDDDARVDEIARMLSGDSITQAARDAALALLKGGQV